MLIPASRFFAGSIYHGAQTFTEQFAQMIGDIESRKKSSSKSNAAKINAYLPRYRYTGNICKTAYYPISQEQMDLFDNRIYKRGSLKRYCFLLAYAGENYSGIQRQRKEVLSSIEEYLLDAMLKCEWITPFAYHYTRDIEFERASRTDKGVSAIRQCVSLLLGN